MVEPQAAIYASGVCSAKYFREVTALWHSPISSRMRRSVLRLKDSPVKSSMLVMITSGFREPANASINSGFCKKSTLRVFLNSLPSSSCNKKVLPVCLAPSMSRGFLVLLFFHAISFCRSFRFTEASYLTALNICDYTLKRTKVQLLAIIGA